MDWRERVTINPQILVGKPIIKGTRISVEFVIDLPGRGWTVDRILAEYDHLTPEDIQACLALKQSAKTSTRPGHSVLDIAPVDLDPMLRPLDSDDDDLLGEMLEGRE